MKYNKNSLLVKSIFYNDIAIILSSFVVFLTVSFILFVGQNDKLPSILEDSNKKIAISYKNLVENIKNGLESAVYTDKFEEYLNKIDETIVYNENGELNTQVNSRIVSDYNDKLYEIVAENLKIKGYQTNEIIGLTITDKDGNLISESIKLDNSSIDKSIYSLAKDVGNFKKNISKNESFSYFDYIEEKDQLVSRTYIKTKNQHKSIEYIVVSIVVNNNFLQKMKEYVSLDEGIKLFVLYDGVYIAGELEIAQGKNFFSSLGFVNNNSTRNSEERVVNGELHSVTYAPIKDGSDRIVGLIGLAISKYSMFQFTTTEYVLSITIIMALLGLISHVFGKVYKREFAPIEDLTRINREITNGNFDVKVRVRAEGELRELADAMKEMIKVVSSNQKNLESENEKLRDQIRRTNMLEKLLLNIHSEDNIDNIIYYILGALTSEVGLDYGRAIYLEYDSEQEVLRGKSSATNIKFIDSENEYFKFQSGLKLHSESLDKVVKLINLDLDDNIVADAFKSCEITYHNDRGFKFKLGSELLTSLGLNNFILFPIFTGKKSYGIIIVDQSMTKKPAQVNDIELLQLLSMNISIHFKNKELEKEKLNTEKDTTISYLSSKILREIQTPTELIKEIMNEFNNGDYIDTEKMTKIQKSINKINNLSTSVLEYADTTQYNFEKLDLKEIVDNSIENIKPMLKNSVIELSKLYTHKNPVIANGKKMEVAVTQILINALEAVDKVGGRLNITTKNKSGGVQIKITDNGVGIEEKNIKRIFDPFVSLKGSSGLGLSIVKKVIGEHGGEIRIKSEPNKGTEVRILLNIYEEE